MPSDRPRRASYATTRDVPLVGPIERALHLRSLAMFEGLPSREIALTSQLMTEERYARGTVLSQEGMPPAKFGLLVAGRVRNERGGRILGIAEPSRLVGLSGVLGGRPASVKSVAETNVTLLSIDAQDFLDVLEDRFAVFQQLRKSYAANVASLQRKLGVFRTSGPVNENPTSPPAGKLSIVEQLIFLQKTSVFRGIPINVVAHLLRDEHELRAEAGQTLWRDGDPSSLVIAIVSGRVQCGGEGVAGAFVAGPGYVLGADAGLGEIPYSYDAVTATPVVAVCVKASALTDFMEDHFELGRRSLEHFAREEVRLLERASDVPG